MAIETKDKQISAAAAVIKTAVDPNAAQMLAKQAIAKAQAGSTGLKAQTEARLKPEKSEAPQIVAAPPEQKKNEQDIAFQRFIQMEILNNARDLTYLSLHDWVKDNTAGLGKSFDLNDKIDLSYAQFQQANPSDKEITARYEANGRDSYIEYRPSAPSSSGGRQGRKSEASTVVTNDGFTPPPYKLDKNQARIELAADIKTVSEMYAAEAGMSPKDFAKVMGGIATIESSFGVLREVKGTKFKSSAGGAFHYLNGTITGETSQAMSDPRIANRVNELGVTFETVTIKKNGKTKQVERLSEQEAWILKQDNILAGSILAKQIVEIVRRNPELRNDVDALTTRVYQSHNLGEAGARALARGGRAALEALDYKADDNNPLFFGGGASDATINKRYTNKVAGAIDSAEPLIAAAFGDGSPIRVAAVKQQQNKVSLPGREPA